MGTAEEVLLVAHREAGPGPPFPVGSGCTRLGLGHSELASLPTPHSRGPRKSGRLAGTAEACPPAYVCGAGGRAGPLLTQRSPNQGCCSGGRRAAPPGVSGCHPRGRRGQAPRARTPGGAWRPLAGQAARTHLGPWKQDACDSPLPAPPPAQRPLRAEAASPRGADAQPTRLRKILESAVGNLEDMRHPCPRDPPSPPGGRGDRGGASLRPGPASVAPALRRLALRSARAPRATQLWLSSTCPRPRPGALCARGQARNAARKRLRSLSFNSVEGTKTPMCANELSFHKPVQLESSCEAG